MKIKLILVGKTNFEFVNQGIKEYEKRMSKFIKFEIIIVKEAKGQLDKNIVKKIESKNILEKINSDDYLILLDNNGSEFDSVKFANFINDKINSNNNIAFVVGGAYGFDDNIYNISNFKVSLSQMTFSHQIIRLIFMEQIYRAFTIINNHPYHNEG